MDVVGGVSPLANPNGRGGAARSAEAAEATEPHRLTLVAIHALCALLGTRVSHTAAARTHAQLLCTTVQLLPTQAAQQGAYSSVAALLGSWLAAATTQGQAAMHSTVVDTLARWLPAQLASHCDADAVRCPPRCGVHALPWLFQCLLRLQLVERALAVRADAESAEEESVSEARTAEWEQTAARVSPRRVGADTVSERAAEARADDDRQRQPAWMLPALASHPAAVTAWLAPTPHANAPGDCCAWEWLPTGRRVDSAAVSALVAQLLPANQTPCVCRFSLLQVRCGALG